MRFPLKEFYEKHGSSNDFPLNRDVRIFFNRRAMLRNYFLRLEAFSCSKSNLRRVAR